MTSDVQPQFVIHPSVEEKEYGTLSFLEEGLRLSPQLYIEALGILALDQQVVTKVLDFVEKHPEGGSGVMRTLRDVFDAGYDTRVDFDKGTNSKIKEDPIIRRIRADRNTPDRVKGLRTRIRRMQIYAESRQDAA